MQTKISFKSTDALVLVLHRVIVYIFSEDEQIFKLAMGHFLAVSSVNMLANTA